MENLASERHGNKQKGFTEAQPTRASSSSITSSSSTLFGRPSTNNKSGFSEKEGLGHSFAAVADAPSTTPTPVKGSVPCPGKIFAITDANSKHALALLDGELKFVEYSHKNQMRGGCWLWNCVEQNGWLGFRNVASGTYLGHDGKGVLTAVKKHHKSYEQLCVRQDPEERGYIFLMAVWDKLGKVGMVGSGQNATWRMAVDVTKPMVWKFVKV
ncbi:hypothetical protein QBC43DRAFT_221653 [Cladorrhinum sp. PSN259]|nr:hypothetical protein QBC43DRAFT_221653 [Cladorrhinum sp. PSN259]